MSEYSLTDAFTMQGVWWLPGKPTERIAGTLRYSPESILLELLGSFTLLGEGLLVHDTTSYETVCGVTNDGISLVLVKTLRAGFRWSFGAAGPVQTDRLMSSLLIIGLGNDSDPLVSAMSCRTPGLAMWLGESPMEFKEENREGLTLRFRQLPTDIIPIPTIDAHIEFETYATVERERFSFSAETQACWHLRANTPQPLSWYLNQIEPVTALLSLCAGVSMMPDQITIQSEDGGRRAYVVLRGLGKEYCTLEHVHEFFLPRYIFSADFSRCVSRWLAIYERIKQPSKLAMSVLLSDKLWPHVEFLSLMQALEGLHRALRKGTYMDPVVYAAIRDQLVQAIPRGISSDHRASLKARLRYGNEISLAKRLQKLTKFLSKREREQIFGEARSVPRQWVETRNYYTHWDETLAPDILDGQRLIYAIARLRSFLRVLYLCLAGVPKAALECALNGTSSEAQFLIQILGMEQRLHNPADQTGILMSITHIPAAEDDPNDRANS